MHLVLGIDAVLFRNKTFQNFLENASDSAMGSLFLSLSRSLYIYISLFPGPLSLSVDLYISLSLSLCLVLFIGPNFSLCTLRCMMQDLVLCHGLGQLGAAGRVVFGGCCCCGRRRAVGHGGQEERRRLCPGSEGCRGRCCRGLHGGGYVLPLVAVVPCDGAGTLHHAGLLVGLGIVVETAAVEGEEGAKFKH
jgi:hypothetical protein